MDRSERVRAEFTREVCRNLEQTGGSSGSSGEREGGGMVSGSSGTSKLRFMAYLCLAAFEVMYYCISKLDRSNACLSCACPPHTQR